MSQFNRVAECVYPTCSAKVSEKFDHPICDWHLAAVYRSVSAAVAVNARPKLGAVRAGQFKADDPGLVYFVLFGDRVKIGFTTNLTERMRTVPHDKVLGVIPGTMRDERALHAMFAEDRINREWFAYSDAIKAYLAALPQQAA